MIGPSEDIALGYWESIHLNLFKRKGGRYTSSPYKITLDNKLSYLKENFISHRLNNIETRRQRIDKSSMYCIDFSITFFLSPYILYSTYITMTFVINLLGIRNNLKQ